MPIEEIHGKNDFIDVSILCFLRQPILLILLLDEIPGYCNFSESETTHDERKHQFRELSLLTWKAMEKLKMTSTVELIPFFCCSRFYNILSSNEN